MLEIADLYAGAGGTTTGIELALEELGIDAHVIAVNHWDVAIETHRANHRKAQQFLTDLDNTRPIELVPGGYLDLLWASPECVFFSRARGGKPVSDQQRMSPWTVVRWLTDLDVAALLVENVPEFVDWGPVDGEGKPVKARKGQYFNAWIRAIQDLGYSVGYKLLNAADYGDATTRTRFFLQARKGEVRLSWPQATHSRRGGRDMLASSQPWRPAAAIIDWSNPGPSLFDRKKPLSVKTRLRIARGLARFAGPLAPYYIRLLDLPEGEERRMSAIAPTGNSPFVVVARENNVPKPVDLPLGTITTMPGMSLAQPTVEPFTFANRNNNAARSMDEPIAAITTSPGGGGIAKVEAAFVLAQGGGGEARPIDQPTPTIVTDGALSLTSAAIVQYHEQSTVSNPADPLPTVTTKDRFALASFVTEHRGTSSVRGSDEPISTVTAGGGHHGLATPEALVVGYQGREDTAHTANEPLTTITAGGKRHSLLTPAVEPFIIPRYGEREGQAPRVHDVDDPLPTIPTTAQHHLVEPTALVLQMAQTSRADNGMGRPAGDPLPTVAKHNNLAVATATPAERASLEGIDPRRLIEIDGQLYVLDIRFRMFTNRELAAATGFPEEYRFAGTKAQVTAQIGNAVPPHTAKALVMAVLESEQRLEAVAYTWLPLERAV